MLALFFPVSSKLHPDSSRSLFIFILAWASFAGLGGSVFAGHLIGFGAQYDVSVRGEPCTRRPRGPWDGDALQRLWGFILALFYLGASLSNLFGGCVWGVVCVYPVSALLYREERAPSVIFYAS